MAPTTTRSVTVGIVASVTELCSWELINFGPAVQRTLPIFVQSLFNRDSDHWQEGISTFFSGHIGIAYAYAYEKWSVL